MLDGLFDDWSDKPCISDPSGDVPNPEEDITQICFYTNPDESNLYFRAERAGGTNELTYQLYIDADNNGSYSDPLDSVVTIDYKPIGNDSQVTILWPGGGTNGDWGQSKKEGGLNVEWMVPFSAVGVSAWQPIQMYLVTTSGGTVIDSTLSIQWTPANALGWILLGALLVAASVWMTYLTRKAAATQAELKTQA